MRSPGRVVDFTGVYLNMGPQQIEQVIMSNMPDARVTVTGDDGVHFDAIVVSPAFAGISPVKRQQMVYAALGDLITSGQVHALGLKTYTPQEWGAKN